MRGEGRVFKRGEIWWLAYNKRGQECRESSQSSDEEFARRLLAGRIAQRNGQSLLGAHAARVTFGTLAQRYCTTHPPDRQMKTHLSLLKKSFGTQAMQDISPATLQQFVTSRRRLGRPAAQIIGELDTFLAVTKAQKDAEVLFFDAIGNALTAIHELKNGMGSQDMGAEGIDMATLQSLLAQRTHPLTILCGIYFLFQDGEIVYVGQSQHILARIYSHLDADKLFDAYAYLEFPPQELDTREAWFIDQLHPRENKAKNRVWRMNTDNTTA